MKPSKDILNELREIAPVLARLDRKNFYQVSEGYFAESTVKIVERAEDVKAHAIDLPPVLASMQKLEIYKIHEGYFALFSDDLMAKIHAEEVAEELSLAAPLMAGLSKTELQKVPANYFSVFPMMVTKLAAKEEIEHMPIGHEISRWSFWMTNVFERVLRPRYSLAMAFTVAIVVVVGIVFSHSTLTPEEKIFAQMQQIPESELQNYMGKHRDDFDEHTILHNINDIEFTHYFDKPENMPSHLKNNNQELPDNISEEIID
ncbi:MAG: hypothetical protein JWO03_981 [Bacteroidetes bacterium]|nr:hypothetical protein [Bacteroidota bacterium]